ncbi:hypothetical protein RHMOL_Rhmol12G0240200 [Rhododendron molle]|uniref:Uncharacterized protein n=1 Tax=Rhododendron molle TaxID=49168 RepID=A0ACC0LM79_RHOML|nr:hypothetical protein RHMOL_Rhmol12G0240200 [Rhododendron molle]
MNLQFFVPSVVNDRIVVSSPEEVVDLGALQETPSRPTILGKKSGSAFQRKEAEGRERARMIPMDSGPFGFKTCIALYIWVLSPNENCIFNPFVWLQVH